VHRYIYIYIYIYIYKHTIIIFYLTWLVETSVVVFHHRKYCAIFNTVACYETTMRFHSGMQTD